MTDKKYAIFDMDGTLLDSMPYWRNILSEYLNMPISKDYAEKIANINVTESIALTIETFGLKKSINQVFNEMNELMKCHYLKHVQPKSGVKEYLQNLKRKGTKMCVASASPPELIKAALKHFDLIDFFDFLCSTEDGFADKNNPDIYLYCTEKFNSKPLETAVFEDSFAAVKTAKKANFHVIAIYDDTQKKYWEQITAIADRSKISWM